MSSCCPCLHNSSSVQQLLCSVAAPSGLQVGGEFAISTAEQQRQIESLQVLDACLTTMTVEGPRMFEGLSIRLYHPLSTHSDTFSHLDRNEGAPAEVGGQKPLQPSCHVLDSSQCILGALEGWQAQGSAPESRS